MTKKKHLIIRVTTVPISMNKILRNQLKFMNQHYDVVGITSPDDLHVREIEQREGIEIIPVPMTRSITPLADMFALLRLYLLFRKLRPSIVHTHTAKAGLLGMAAAWMARVPVRLHTMAGSPPCLWERAPTGKNCLLGLLRAVCTGIRKRVLRSTEIMMCMFAHRLYPNSFGLKDTVIQNRLCPPNKLKVIANGSSNGIDTEWFSREAIGGAEGESKKLRMELNIPANAFVFCFVGRMVVDKGIGELCEAFTRIHSECIDKPVSLLLVGPFEQVGNGLDDRAIDEINNHPAIVTTGSVADVRPYLAASDLFVFPSYREGLPSAVLQACAMEVPAIVSDIVGCIDIIENGYNGLIMPVKDSNAIYEAMKNMLEDKDLYVRIKANTRGSIIGKYEQEYVLQELLAEYQGWVSQL